MKCRNFEVEHLGTHLQFVIYGFNEQDVFANSFGALKKTVWYKNPNKPEIPFPGLPVLSYSFQIHGDTSEQRFAKWFGALISFTESMKYIPVSLDMLYLNGMSLKAKVSYRFKCKNDKSCFTIRCLETGSVFFENTVKGFKATAKINLQ